MFVSREWGAGIISRFERTAINVKEEANRIDDMTSF